MGNDSLNDGLVQAGADVNAQCASGLTALHVACRGQAVLVATLLLAAGVDGGLRDSRGCTALHYAAQTANWGLFSLLHAHVSCRPGETDPQGEKILTLPSYQTFQKEHDQNAWHTLHCQVLPALYTISEGRVMPYGMSVSERNDTSLTSDAQM